MNKKYKIAVSDTVVVPVTVKIADANQKQEVHRFSLVCRRVDAEHFKEKLSGDFNARDFMLDVTTGWWGQRLVLEDDDTPAEFCPGAMEALLNISGMAIQCFNAYGKESSAKEKN